MVQLAAGIAALVVVLGCGAANEPAVTGKPATFPAFALADTNRNTVTYGRTVTRDSLLSPSFSQQENPGSRATRASVVYFGWST